MLVRSKCRYAADSEYYIHTNWYYKLYYGITSVLINVTQAVPTITWSNPANIISGIPLSSNQLDATPSVPGTFVYTPL